MVKKYVVFCSLTILILLLSQVAMANDIFLQNLSNCQKQYETNQYLEAKVALMKVTASLDYTLTKALENGDIIFIKLRSVCNDLTDIQFNKFKEDLQGKKVTWSGYIFDIEEKWLGIEIKMDMDSPEHIPNVYDVILRVQKETKDLVSTFSKGQQIKFKGKMTGIKKNGRLIIHLDDIEFL